MAAPGSINYLSTTQLPKNEYEAKILDIQRRQAMAGMLSGSGIRGNQEASGNMVSGRFVPKATTQHLADALRTGLGAYGANKAQGEITDLSTAMGAKRTAGIEKYTTLLKAGDLDGAAAALLEAGTTTNDPALQAAGLKMVGERAHMAQLLGGGQTPGAQPRPGSAGGSPTGAPQGMRGWGGPAGGISMGQWLAVDKTGEEYAKALAKDNEAQTMRAGGSRFDPITNRFTATAPTQGIQTTWGPNGPQASSIPGYSQAKAGIEGPSAEAGSAGKARGAAPFTIDTLATKPPTAVTREQAIIGATGKPMPGLPYSGAAPQGPPAALPPGFEPPPPGAPQASQFMPGNAPPVAAPHQVAAQVQQGRPALPGIQLQDEGAKSEEQAFGKELGKSSMKIMEGAGKAAVANRYLDNLEAMGDDVRLGKIARPQSALIQWAQAIGIPVPDWAKKSAGSTQGLASIAIKLAGVATRESDAQPSQLQFLKTLESMPTEERSREGFTKIIAYMRDINNYNISKAQSLQGWRDAHQGSSEGFEAAWPAEAAQLPLVWNKAQGAAGGAGNPSAQSVADELRRRGLIR